MNVFEVTYNTNDKPDRRKEYKTWLRFYKRK